jgi:hypothetical protein
MAAAVRRLHYEPRDPATRVDNQGNRATASNPALGSPRVHALHDIMSYGIPLLRGGVLPADRLSLGCSIVTDVRAGLRAGGGARHKPKQCDRSAGTPRSSATAAVPTGGG